MDNWFGDILTGGFLEAKFPDDGRVKVNELKRIGPPQNGGWFYYSPDGHAIGPFDYEEEMEADIKKHYKES